MGWLGHIFTRPNLDSIHLKVKGTVASQTKIPFGIFLTVYGQKWRLSALWGNSRMVDKSIELLHSPYGYLFR